MKDLDIIGADSIAATGVFGSKTDYIRFQQEVLIPAFHYQPLTARKVCQPTPIDFDGKTRIDIPIYEDLPAPDYAMQPKHKDSDLQGDYVSVMLPQLYMTALFSTDELRQPFGGRDRLQRWVWQAANKIAQWEDIIAFRGDTSNGIVGFIGANSNDLGSPSGVWGAATTGYHAAAYVDLLELITYFVDEGLGDRPITIVMTNAAYMVLLDQIQYTAKTNLSLWYDTLPEGSRIMHSANIQASPGPTSNTMVGLVDLAGPDEGGYQLFSSNIQQGIHQTDIWEYRYGVKEKFSVKVADDAYVCWMDGISNATS